MLLPSKEQLAENFWLTKRPKILITLTSLVFNLVSSNFCYTMNKGLLTQEPLKTKSTKTKLFFKSGEVSAYLDKFLIEARNGVDVKYKNIELKTNKAFLHFNKDKSLEKIVAPKKSIITKKDLKIDAKELVYYLQNQTIVCKGETTIKRKDSTITGRNIKYNLITDEMIGENISGIL